MFSYSSIRFYWQHLFVLQVPVLAVLGSGGGFRAMVGFSGVMKALYDSGVLDCVTYVAGLSGSTWYKTWPFTRALYSSTPTKPAFVVCLTGTCPLCTPTQNSPPKGRSRSTVSWWIVSAVILSNCFFPNTSLTTYMLCGARSPQDSLLPSQISLGCWSERRLFLLWVFYIYAFDRCFCPKWLTVHSRYTFFSMHVPWVSNPSPLCC